MDWEGWSPKNVVLESVAARTSASALDIAAEVYIVVSLIV